jgi:hypothetical protein
MKIIKTSEALPKSGRYVLAWMEGAKIPMRAMWAAQHTLPLGDDADPEWGEYNEEKDEYFCPAGWYEMNQHEEQHWGVSGNVVAWCELPRLHDQFVAHIELAGAAPAAVAPQGEYPYLPQSVGDVTDFGDGKVDIDWGHPAPAGGTRLYSADQMRAYVDADRAARAAQPAAVAGPAREEIAALREEHGITSTGRGIKEFEQVDAFVRAVLQRWGAAPALEAPAAPVCERCGLSPAEHNPTHWCDNQSFSAASPQAPAAPVEDAGEPALGEWPRVSGVGRDAESPRTLLLYLQTEASDDELRAIHDALLDGGALATHALSELMHIGYRVEGGKLVPPEKLSDCASEFFGASALTAKATAAHSDDLAVDRFAAEMKSKLAAARAKGRGGWETCPPEVLSRMLREHTDKGDPRDVANFCMLLWCLDQPISEAAPAVDADGDSWYLQDTRSYVGNDVLWWAKDGKGYTTDVSKAHVFTREEAFSQAAMRVVDRAWPKAYIDGKTRPAVDMQYINHDQAIAAQAAAKGGGIVSKTERLGHANALIEIISRHGRRFFRNRESGAIARLELDASGRLWWIDEYRGSRVYTGKVMGYPHRWRGFSHGGTLRSLVEALRGYVLRGELLHPEYIAPSRIDPTNGDIWGYGAEAAAAVRAEAHALPLFQRPTGHKEST